MKVWFIRLISQMLQTLQASFPWFNLSHPFASPLFPWVQVYEYVRVCMCVCVYLALASCFNAPEAKTWWKPFWDQQLSHLPGHPSCPSMRHELMITCHFYSAFYVPDTGTFTFISFNHQNRPVVYRVHLRYTAKQPEARSAEDTQLGSCDFKIQTQVSLIPKHKSFPLHHAFRNRQRPESVMNLRYISSNFFQQIIPNGREEGRYVDKWVWAHVGGKEIQCAFEDVSLKHSAACT